MGPNRRKLAALTLARPMLVLLVMLAACLGGCSRLVRIGPLVAAGKLVKACRALSGVSDLSEPDLARLLVKRARVKVALWAVSGVALRQMLGLDPFAPKAPRDFDRRMLLAMQMKYAMHPSLRITIKDAPDMQPCRKFDEFCSYVGEHSPWFSPSKPARLASLTEAMKTTG